MKSYQQSLAKLAETMTSEEKEKIKRIHLDARLFLQDVFSLEKKEQEWVLIFAQKKE